MRKLLNPEPHSVAVFLIAISLVMGFCLIASPIYAYRRGHDNGEAAGIALATTYKAEADGAQAIAEKLVDECAYWKGQTREATETIGELRAVSEDASFTIEQLEERVSELEADLSAAKKAAAPKASTKASTRSTSGVEQWRPLVVKYFGTATADAALRVMAGESSGNPRAVNGSCRGLFQIHECHAEKFAEVTKQPYSTGVFNPEANIRFAAYMSARGTNWSSWSVQP